MTNAVTNAVETDALVKRYADRTVVDEVDLRVPQGCVYGFLGPNGSGKSTTLKMVLSLVRPTSGAVRVLGVPVTRATRPRVLTEVGALIEAPPGYAHLTGAENMAVARRAMGLSAEQVGRAVEAVGLQDQMGKRVRAYSLGMKQRLGIALALARDPRLLVLDEPTNGLDPAGVEEVRLLLRSLAERGVAVLVSSHLLGEVDRTASHLGVLASGRLVFQGTREELLGRSSPDVVVRCGDPRAAAAAVGAAPGREAPPPEVHLSDRPPSLVLRRPSDAQVARAVEAVVHAGVPVLEVRRQEQSLEDVFRALTAGGTR